MATWDITSHGKSWAVRYTSPVLSYDCGLTDKDVSDFEEVVAWVSDEADSGDLIRLGSTLLFQKMPALED